MTPIAQALLAALRCLPKEEQLEIIHTLQAELDPETPAEISAAELAETERRLEETRQERLSAVRDGLAIDQLRSML